MRRQPALLVACRADKAPHVTHALAQKGFDPLIVPIVTTTPVPPRPVPEGAQGVVLTSSAAVPALQFTQLPCYCVGPKTAAAAQAAGLTVACCGNSNGAGLAQWLLKNTLPHTLYHPTTAKGVRYWYDVLQQAGFSVLPEEVYKTMFLPTLPAEVVLRLRENDVPYFMVFSPRGSAHLVALLRAEGVNLEHRHIFALSHTTAAPFIAQGVPQNRVHIAPQPMMEVLINVLEQQAQL